MKPYGLKPYTGYGDECYFRSLHDEVILPICSRNEQKKRDKAEIKIQLEEQDDMLDYSEDEETEDMSWDW